MDAATDLRMYIGVPRSHEDLCRLVARAPELKLVANCARMIGDASIIPDSAIPTKELTKVCLDTYHRWVAALSRVK